MSGMADEPNKGLQTLFEGYEDGDPNPDSEVAPTEQPCPGPFEFLTEHIVERRKDDRSANLRGKVRFDGEGEDKFGLEPLGNLDAYIFNETKEIGKQTTIEIHASEPAFQIHKRIRENLLLSPGDHLIICIDPESQQLVCTDSNRTPKQRAWINILAEKGPDIEGEELETYAQRIGSSKTYSYKIRRRFADTINVVRRKRNKTPTNYIPGSQSPHGEGGTEGNGDSTNPDTPKQDQQKLSDSERHELIHDALARTGLDVSEAHAFLSVREDPDIHINEVRGHLGEYRDEIEARQEEFDSSEPIDEADADGSSTDDSKPDTTNTDTEESTMNANTERDPEIQSEIGDGNESNPEADLSPSTISSLNQYRRYKSYTERKDLTLDEALQHLLDESDWEEQP